jgi:hypothetical protein
MHRFHAQTFVAQCQEDLDTLNDWVNDSDRALGRRVRVATHFRTQNPESLLAPPMSPEEVGLASTPSFDTSNSTYLDAADRF